MLNSGGPALPSSSDADAIYSVIDRIMIEFGEALERLEGFEDVGSDFASLFRREKAPNEAELRQLLEGDIS